MKSSAMSQEYYSNLQYQIPTELDVVAKCLERNPLLSSLYSSLSVSIAPIF